MSELSKFAKWVCDYLGLEIEVSTILMDLYRREQSTGISNQIQVVIKDASKIYKLPEKYITCPFEQIPDTFKREAGAAKEYVRCWMKSKLSYATDTWIREYLSQGICGD